MRFQVVLFHTGETDASWVTAQLTSSDSIREGNALSHEKQLKQKTQIARFEDSPDLCGEDHEIFELPNFEWQRIAKIADLLLPS